MACRRRQQLLPGSTRALVIAFILVVTQVGGCYAQIDLFPRASSAAVCGPLNCSVSGEQCTAAEDCCVSTHECLGWPTSFCFPPLDGCVSAGQRPEGCECDVAGPADQCEGQLECATDGPNTGTCQVSPPLPCMPPGVSGCPHSKCVLLEPTRCGAGAVRYLRIDPAAPCSLPLAAQ